MAISLALFILLATNAFAQRAEFAHKVNAEQRAVVQYTGLNTNGIVNVYKGDTFYGRLNAGEMGLQINGSQEAAYRMDLDTSVSKDIIFEAFLMASVVKHPYGEIGYILSHFNAEDAFSAAQSSSPSGNCFMAKNL